MGEQEQSGEEGSTLVTGGSPAASAREAQLDAAIEASFPASDPISSFDFR